MQIPALYMGEMGLEGGSFNISLINPKNDFHLIVPEGERNLSHIPKLFLARVWQCETRKIREVTIC